MNRLQNETSPYLLQHSTNPVDWYPWCEEVFELAKEQNKPIFLSIGYSTCHWCHVMEKESFQDEETAKILNDVFICIKVDREERPDIDNIYMKISQEMTGSGGWPLSIFMTSDKNPFFAATYIPKHDRFNSLGLINLSKKVHEHWQSNNSLLCEQSRLIMDEIRNRTNTIIFTSLSQEELIHQAYTILKNNYDKVNGGFGSAPKFPQFHLLNFLLGYSQKYKSVSADEMVNFSLKRMLSGGIYDHIGFGLHRYSTDKYWRIPHFEKMLYDQAMLISVLSEAYLVSQDIFYQKRAEETINYLNRKLLSPYGAFYCGEDADSEGYEGKCYLWKFDELKILKDDLQIFQKYFDVSESGNYENGYNALYLNIENNNENELDTILERCKNTLLKYREHRIQPSIDSKIITDWNGLIIAAFAKAWVAFNNDNYLNIAKAVYSFIKNNLFQNGSLFHSQRSGKEFVEGFLNDYSFFIYGILQLYLAGPEEEYLNFAVELNDKMISGFYEDGRLFFKSKNSKEEILRTDDPYDGAIPSGISVAYYNNIMLGKITGENRYKEIEENIIRSYIGMIERNPASFAFMLNGILLKTKEYVKIDIPEKNKNLMKLRGINNNLIVSISRKTDMNTYQICSGEKCMIFGTFEEIKKYLQSI